MFENKWEIMEEPELYWQWITRDGKVLVSLETELGNAYIAYDICKFAGPWIKTEYGFVKHESWEQY